jgi:tetratricopeptide (TPR) repeat protein
MKYQVSPEQRFNSGLSGKGVLKGVLAIAFMTISVLTFGQSPEIRKAFRLIDIEQPSKGISALEQQAGSNAANQYYLGLAYLRTGNKEKALAAFEKGISLDEKNGLNYAGKGYVKILDKNSAEAKTNFDKALAVSKSKDAGVLKAVAEGYLQDSKLLLDAINLLNKAKTINASDPDVNLLLGDAYLMQNNGGESVNSYERAATADPKNGKPNYKIAKVYQRSKNHDMVMENLNKAISVDPEYAPAYKELGQVYYVKKQADQAVEAYEKYLAITETPGEARSQYAFFLFMAKKFDKANAIFKEVINSPNPSPTALKYYAYSLIEQDKNQDQDAKNPEALARSEQARGILEKYFQVAKPEDLQASDYSYYGKLLLQLSQDSLANENFARSLDLDSAQTEILHMHGTTLVKRKKYAEAIPVFKQLISMRKQPLAQDLWSIGQAYYFNDQFMEADTAFTKLAEKQPTVIHGHLWAARSKAQIDSLGEQGLAAPVYEKVIEIALQNPEKNKKELIESYDYLGQVALHQKNDVLKAKGYFEKILGLDPTNARAKEFMKQLNAPAQQQKGGKK